MGNNRFWLRIFNVRAEEWWVVKKLFWLQFFQGAGISFFFTAAFARFLDKFPIQELPWVMVYSSVLLWLTGLIFSKLETKLSFQKFNSWIIIAMGASMFLIYLGSNVLQYDWFLYFSLAWFNVLYLLNNLEFWGIASNLFDIRQSKRLFGLVSSGDIPAKFIGYTLALIFVSYTGTLNLILVGMICMFLSFPFLLSIAREEKKHFHQHTVSHSKKKKAEKPLRTLVKNFLFSTIIRRIAIISLIASACIILVNYGLYAEVKGAFKDDVALAKFIALFMAMLRLVALITKTIFTSRLATHLGVRRSLFITPALLAVLVLIMLFLNWQNPSDVRIFYFFGVLSIAVDVLRTSINSPVLLTVMQPLPTHERMRAHHIVKGIMDPFANLICGILLLILYRIEQKIDLIAICYILLIFSVLWLIGIFRVNQVYLNMLIKTISSRYFSQEEFSLNDANTISKIKEKIKTGTTPEVLSVLNMVASKQNPISEDLLRTFLAHQAENVQIETIKIIAVKRIHDLREELYLLIKESPFEIAKQEAIKTICQLARSAEEFYYFLFNDDDLTIKSAVSGMLCNPEPGIRKLAEERLEKLLKSGSKLDLEKAIEILNEVRDEYDHSHHAKLLLYPDPTIRKAAIEAIGKNANEQSLKALSELVDEYPKLVLGAWYRASFKSVAHIENYLLNKNHSPSRRDQLILLLGKIGGNKSWQTLTSLLKKLPAATSFIIKAMYRGKYRSTKENRADLENFARAYTRYGVELLNMLLTLRRNNQPSTLLGNAIQIELMEIREVLINLFGCLYDREKIKKVRSGLLANNRESIANAMEIIEVTVKKDIGKYFNILFEPSSISDRCNALRPLYTLKQELEMEEILGQILSEKPINYLDWTKACSLFISKKYGVDIDNQLSHRYLESESKILKETALYACA